MMDRLKAKIKNEKKIYNTLKMKEKELLDNYSIQTTTTQNKGTNYTA